MSKNTNNQSLQNKNQSQKGHKRVNSNSYNQNHIPGNLTLNTNITQHETSQVTNTNSNNQTANPGLLTNMNRFQTSGYDNSQYGNTSNTSNILANLNTTNNLPEQRPEDINNLYQKIDCVGKVPTPRFGHTITMISPVKVVLFGGAIGDTRNFQFTSDTYVLNLMTKIWLKLESKITFNSSKRNNCSDAESSSCFM